MSKYPLYIPYRIYNLLFYLKQKEIILSTRLVGQRFGHLTVIKDTGKRLHRSIIWECLCDCGNKHEVTSNNLKGG